MIHNLQHRAGAPLAVPLAVLACLTVLSGCTTGGTSDADLTVIDDARLEALREEHGRGLVLLDPRPASDYRWSHLPGALSLPLPEIRPGHPALRDAEAIVVYGEGWGDVVSPAAAKKLIALGYDPVYDFRGGVELWRASGRELVRPHRDSGAP